MNLEFHHVGVICRDLDRESNILAHLGYQPERPDFYDPVQGVYGRFLTGGGPRLELLRPASDDGVLTPWMKSETKLYHLAYFTADIEHSLCILRSQRAKVLVPPVSAIAFSNRHIAFVMMPNMLLIEIITKGNENED